MQGGLFTTGKGGGFGVEGVIKLISNFRRIGLIFTAIFWNVTVWLIHINSIFFLLFKIINANHPLHLSPLTHTRTRAYKHTPTTTKEKKVGT